MRLFLAVWLLLFGLSVSFALQANTRVAFFNPGSVTDSFWADVDNVMSVASEKLAIDLTVTHADRDHFKMISQLDEALKGSKEQLPRFVMIVNEKQSAMKMLQMLSTYPIYVQLVFNDVSPSQRQQLLQDPHWQQYLLPAIEPDNHAIGSMMATALTKDIHPPKNRVLMMTGDKSTPASVLRVNGAITVFQQAQPQIELTQVIYGQWSEDIAYDQMQTLLTRYPDLSGIWTASDQMAFGVIRALNEHAIPASKQVLVTSVNTSQRALELRKQGQINVLVGGHFLVGALGLYQITEFERQGHYVDATEVRLLTALTPDDIFFKQLELQDWTSIFQSEIVDVLGKDKERNEQ